MLNFKDLKLTDVRPCSYARISVDTDEARDENASIENQKLIPPLEFATGSPCL